MSLSNLLKREYLQKIKKITKETSTWLLNTGLNIFLKFCINILKVGPIPHHVAFIIDGNRRYAKNERIGQHLGYSKGYDKLDKIISGARVIGIKEVTTYLFSIENFKRNPEEVDIYMKVVIKRIELILDNIDKYNKDGLCIRVIGNVALIPNPLRARLARVVLLTKDNHRTVWNIAFAYTSQDEITNAFQEIAEAVRGKQICKQDIDENLISKCMYSGKSKMPDILIRTSGEVRFSNFLLWQCQNTHVIFVKTLWPSFSRWKLMACIFNYQMHYADQQHVEKLCGTNYKDNNNERVELFLKELATKRFKYFEKYALQN